MTIRLASLAVAVSLILLGRSSTAFSEEQDQQAAQLSDSTRALSQPIDFDAQLGDPRKHTVLIYYANETAPDEAESRNYAQLLEWLESSDSDRIKKLAAGIEKELEDFHAVVDAEIDSISTHLAKMPADRALSAAILTNRLGRHSAFRIWRAGAQQPEEGQLEVPKFDELAYNSNPLSHPQVFNNALTAIAAEFDPAQHQFILITKSHGGREIALSPRISLDVSQTTRGKLLAELEKAHEKGPSDASQAPARSAETGHIAERSKIGDPILDPVKFGDPILGKAGNTLSPEETSTLASAARTPALGTTKQEYLATLVQRSEAGMQFPLLFIESCKSELDELQVQDLKANRAGIGRLFTSDIEGLEYATIDYGDVFRRVDEGSSLIEAVNQTLLAKHEQQKAARTNR